MRSISYVKGSRYLLPFPPHILYSPISKEPHADINSYRAHTHKIHFSCAHHAGKIQCMQNPDLTHALVMVKKRGSPTFVKETEFNFNNEGPWKLPTQPINQELTEGVKFLTD